jgi:hypothetical protein
MFQCNATRTIAMVLGIASGNIKPETEPRRLENIEFSSQVFCTTLKNSRKEVKGQATAGDMKPNIFTKVLQHLCTANDDDNS